MTPSNFPPKTTADLVALCSAQKSDPFYVAAVNFCQGFAEGAVEIALSYSAVRPQSHRPFCLASPPSTLEQATSDLTSWANADAARLDRPALIGLIGYLIDRYPCPHEATAQRGKRRRAVATTRSQGTEEASDEDDYDCRVGFGLAGPGML